MSLPLSWTPEWSLTLPELDGSMGTCQPAWAVSRLVSSGGCVHARLRHDDLKGSEHFLQVLGVQWDQEGTDFVSVAPGKRETYSGSSQFGSVEVEW